MDGVTAPRNYEPGSVIYSEPAFAQVVNRQYKDVLCEFCCNGSLFGLRACTRCLAVKYCGKNCQKNDWSSHKLECKHLKNLPQGPSADFVRLLGKVILKIKGKDWKHITSKVFGKEISFDDIDCHFKEMTENPRMVLFFEEVKELTGKYIGFENLPDDESLIKIVGKVRFNMFRNQIRISGFFIGAVKFSLECIPNSNATVWGNQIKIWAFKKIRKGKDKITLPGRMIYLPDVRARFAEGDAITSCQCTDCCQPYGESILFKIIDKKRAFSVIRETEKFLDVAETFSNVLRLPEAKEFADRLLRDQEGVLGDTHYLRMGLLALRSMSVELQEHSFDNKRLLLKLERSMRSAFGEYYLEMAPIYKVLSCTNLHLGFPEAAREYAEKAVLMEAIMTNGLFYRPSSGLICHP